MISSYLTVTVYAEFHKWLGRGDALAPMWEAWAAGDRKRANEVIPDAVVDELVIHGSYDECREHVLRYVEAGIEIRQIPFRQLRETGTGTGFGFGGLLVVGLFGGDALC